MAGIRGRRIAMIFQEPGAALNPVVTVGEQIVDVLRAHHGLSRGEARARAVGLLRDVGIPEPATRLAAFPHQLTGGTQQRVAIAIALACEPDLLIADEPTTALDVTIQAQILELLRRLTSEKGLGSHSSRTISAPLPQIADRIIVMYAGRVVEDGPVDVVIDTPHIRTRAPCFAPCPRWRPGVRSGCWKIEDRCPISPDSRRDAPSTRAARPSCPTAGYKSRSARN